MNINSNKTKEIRTALIEQAKQQKEIHQKKLNTIRQIEKERKERTTQKNEKMANNDI